MTDLCMVLFLYLSGGDYLLICITARHSQFAVAPPFNMPSSLHPSMENIWLPCIPKITSRPNQQTDCLFACEVRSIPFHSDPFDSTAFPHCNAPAARQLMSAAAVEKTSPRPFLSIKNRRKIIEASPDHSVRVN